MSQTPKATSSASELEAQAKARKAEAEAKKAELEIPGPAELAAKARKAIAEAERDAATAEKQRHASLIPDFGSVAKSTLEEKSGEAFGSAFLAFGTLDYLSESVAAKVHPALRKTSAPKVLVTSDLDLASSDAVYHEVTGGLERLRRSAASLLQALDTPKAAPADSGTAAAYKTLSLVPPATALAAIAGAVPGALSLFTGQRTLTTGAAAAPDSLAAAAAVMSALHVASLTDALELVLDDFRLVPASPVYTTVRTLADARDLLLTRKMAVHLEQDAAKVRLAQKQRQHAAMAKEAKPKDPGGAPEPVAPASARQ